MAALKQTAIECLTLCLTRGMNGEILSLIVNLEIIRLEDSGAAFRQKKLSLWTSGHAWW